MKRILVYIFALAFVLSAVGSASAIDVRTNGVEVSAIKKKEKKKVDKPKQPTEPKQAPDPPPQKPKKYDDFVDQNNNGIDDRKENLKEKPTEKDKPEQKDKTEKPG